MKAKFALITLACISVSGCATVDLANMGGTENTSTATAKADQGNVVKRAASKLYAAFTSQGWVENKSRKRVQSAASVLLRGLDTSTEDSPLSDYALKSPTLEQITSDIQTAQNYVSQTTKAAEVYLAMASDDTNLREELSGLQKALIASREAEIVFTEALTKKGVAPELSLADYTATVDGLRDITDDFGDRVRSARTLTSALQPEIN